MFSVGSCLTPGEWGSTVLCQRLTNCGLGHAGSHMGLRALLPDSLVGGRCRRPTVTDGSTILLGNPTPVSHPRTQRRRHACLRCRAPLETTRNGSAVCQLVGFKLWMRRIERGSKMCTWDHAKKTFVRVVIPHAHLFAPLLDSLHPKLEPN